MAAGDHNPSRRALLGAAVGLPLLPLDGGGWVGVDFDAGRGVPGAQPGSTLTSTLPSPVEGEEEWRRALAAFERAEAELRAFERRTAGAPWEVQDAVEQGMDACLDAFLPALRRLLRTPAPDLEALLTKFALITDYQVTELTDGEACMTVFRQDAERLAGTA